MTQYVSQGNESLLDVRCKPSWAKRVEIWQKTGNSLTWTIVVYSGHSRFHVVFVPLEYVPTIPLHCTYIIIIVGKTRVRNGFKPKMSTFTRMLVGIWTVKITKNPTIFTIHSSIITLINVYICGSTCPCCGKSGANTLRALLTFEKYETTNYEVFGMRRYSQNIFQWNKTT